MDISSIEKINSLRKIAERAIYIYNKTRSPEATARIISINENEQTIEVEFTGKFCFTCGVRDWVEDLAYVIEQLGYRAILEKYIEPDNSIDRRIGVFKVIINNL